MKRANKENLSKICFVGNMLGRNSGFVTTQGQILADAFAADGWAVISVSSHINRTYRLADIIKTIFTRRNEISLVVLEVYSGLSMVLADAASSLCRLLNLPLIAVLHGGNLPDFTQRYPSWTKRVLGYADRLVAPSPFLAEKLGFLNSEIEVIPNVLQIENYKFRLRSEIAPRLIWMRSFHPIYNPQLAVKAFAEVQRLYPQASLVMAGIDKGIENDVKNLAQTLGLKDSVRFAGFLDLKAKSREFSAADVYLNTNRIDNMPVSVIEAAALGLPVVATNVGGVPYLLQNGENGLLVADDDKKAMAEAILQLLSDARLTEKISRNGRLLAEKSAWKSVKVQWEMLFDEVLEKKIIPRRTTVERTVL